MAIWHTTQTNVEQCLATLFEKWVPEALSREALLQLIVNVADIDQGAFRNGPMALLNIGLESAHDLDDVPERDLLHAIASRLEVWRVATLCPKQYVRDWPDATVSRGIKMISLMQRASDISHAQFVQHWTQRHAPLALQHHVGLWNYRQNVVRRAYTPGGRAVDGIAELHFETRDDYDTKFFDDDAGRAIIFEDIPKFMRLDASQTALMTEYIFRTAANVG